MFIDTLNNNNILLAIEKWRISERVCKFRSKFEN